MTSDVARIATSTCDKLLAKKDTFGDQCVAVRAELENFAKTCKKLEVSDAAKKKAFGEMIKAMSSTLETTHAIDAFVRALEKVRNEARRGVLTTRATRSRMNSEKRWTRPSSPMVNLISTTSRR